MFRLVIELDCEGIPQKGRRHRKRIAYVPVLYPNEGITIGSPISPFVGQVLKSYGAIGSIDDNFECVPTVSSHKFSVEPFDNQFRANCEDIECIRPKVSSENGESSTENIVRPR